MKIIQLRETELTRLIQRVINEIETPLRCCNPECSKCSKDCDGDLCDSIRGGEVTGGTVSDHSEFMDEPHIGESDLRRLIRRVINEEGPIYGPGVGICLCPPPWQPCGCLGQAMSMGIAPEDMDPADFKGNEDTSKGMPNLFMLGGEDSRDEEEVESGAVNEWDLRRLVRRVLNKNSR